jgi:hypothetical protein
MTAAAQINGWLRERYIKRSAAQTYARIAWGDLDGTEAKVWSAWIFGAPINGTLAATLGAASVSATGRLAIKGSASATLATLTASGSAALSLLAQGAATLDTALLSASGSMVSVVINGSLDATLEQATAAATGRWRSAVKDRLCWMVRPFRHTAHCPSMGKVPPGLQPLPHQPSARLPSGRRRL